MPKSKSKKRFLKPKQILTACLLCLLSISALLMFSFYSVFLVSGSSMQPSYPPYSLVIINKSGFDSLRAGDTVVFKSSALNNSLAFHRVVRVTSEGVYTKGDNNKSEDNQLITKETYVGTESFKITAFAKYLILIKSLAGFIFFFLMPFSAVVFIVISLKTFKGMRKA